MKLIEGKDLEPILAKYPPERHRLIPLLQDVQAELGYLPPEAVQAIADHFNILAAEVFGVASFYNQFRFSPPGKHQVKVCLGTACHVKGGEVIMDSWARRLGIKEGETTPNRLYSLERVACVGCCSLAPVVVVGEEVYAHVMTSTIEGILLKYELKEEQPQGKSQS